MGDPRGYPLVDLCDLLCFDTSTPGNETRTIDVCLDGWTLHIGPRMGSTGPGGTPNDGPATPVGNSRVTEGPSSVSESLTVIFKQQERGSKMSKPMKAILLALLIALVSSVLL